MLSKKLFTLTAGVAAAGAFNQSPKPKMNLKRRGAHPKVQFTPGCDTNLAALKKGPANIPQIIEAGEQYTDPDFGAETNTIYWPNGEYKGVDDFEWTVEYEAEKGEWYQESIDDGEYSWQHWQTYTPDRTIFGEDGDPHYGDIEQGEGGTCYALAAMSASAKHSQILKDVILTPEKNDAGIHGVRLFIRGKPWHISIDDIFLFVDEDEDYPDDVPYLLFASSGLDDAMWPAIVEKAWAKVKGSYYNASGGNGATFMGLLTGAPAYSIRTQGDLCDGAADMIFEIVQTAIAENYPMNINTHGGGQDTDMTDCGIPDGHQYSLLDAFTITDKDGEEVKMVMVRDPYGESEYKNVWNQGSSEWTDEVAQQVIDRTDVDPRTSSEEHGIFFLPHNYAVTCFQSFDYAIIREGYSDNWYDALDMDETFHSYYFTTPEKDGDLYVNVQTYQDMIISQYCMEPDAEVWGENAFDSWLMNPLVSVIIYKANATDKQFKKIYVVRWQHGDQPRPITILEDMYEEGDVFAIDVKFVWQGEEGRDGRDYTVKVHSKMDLTITDSLDRENQLHTDGQSPSEFTEEGYCGLDIDCTPNEAYEGKETDANEEEYDGDIWYLQSDIPSKYFSNERDEDDDAMVDALFDDPGCFKLDGLNQVIEEIEDSQQQVPSEDDADDAGDDGEDGDAGDDGEDGDAEKSSILVASILPFAMMLAYNM